MSKHRKSLLDAFRTVPPAKGDVVRAPVPEPARTVAPRTEARADAVIPVRVAVPPPAPRKPGTHTDVAGPRPPVSRERVVLLSLLALTIVVVVVIALKGKGVEGVAAASGKAPVTGAVSPANVPVRAAEVPAGPVTRPAFAAGVGTTEDDRAFLDPKNRFTVRLAQYENDPGGEKLARDAYRILRGGGVPVVQPIVSGDGAKLYLCADAQPKMDPLADLCTKVKSYRGPGGKKGQFDGAFIDNIDHVIKR